MGLHRVAKANKLGEHRMSYVDNYTRPPEEEELLIELARRNRFTMAELAKNRTGIIADSQMWKLAAQAMRPIYTAGMTFAGWMIFLLVIYAFVPNLLLRIVTIFLAKSMSLVYLSVLLTTLGCVLSLIV